MTVAWLLVLGACAPAEEETTADDAGTAGVFIAQNVDFQGFQGWEKFPVMTNAVDGGHAQPGNSTVYLNRRPPSGSTTYPVGTILMKITENGPAENWEIHAMAKRGGSYNRYGAPGWEWFELLMSTDGTQPVILWRGVEPPDGENYRDARDGGFSGNCSACHGGVRDRDFVFTEGLLTP
ncbi:MAG: hypothetical protein AB2A00_09885 [Myxococcota bacterium]